MTPITSADRFRSRYVESEEDDEVPASKFENRADGAEKIEPSRYSDFFNRIDPVPFKFTGKIDKLTFKLEPQKDVKAKQ